MNRIYDLSELIELNETVKPTIELLERLYEQGYAAIVNDGKLIGFVKENAL